MKVELIDIERISKLNMKCSTGREIHGTFVYCNTTF
jgi:hypothetical protein